ncbi:hypothetical protein G9A89_021006 [Geosiphon pyriformis]|nr:hypothetical protein G9A89_021006 [Geosiphon pyriformis]
MTFAKDPPKTLEDTQYAKKANHYIEILNSLRRLGAHHAVDLPTVVFCGNQSAGKSSLLEAISGVQLPRSEGTCTRCVMEIRLIESSSPWECQISLRQEYDDITEQQLPRPLEYKFGSIIKSPSEVEMMARRAQKALLNPSMNYQLYVNWIFNNNNIKDAAENHIKFTKNVVCLEIKGPKVPNLSLIDLPGIIRHVEHSQDEKFINLIQEVVEDYIQKEKSIIIATVTCRDEIENQAIVGMAKKVDKEGIRTLGVLTKPDTIEPGEDEIWGMIIRGEAHRLRLGYYVVKNPAKLELSKGITFEEARKSEEKFFSTIPMWKNMHLKNRMGVANLRGKLSELLIKAIERNLPVIKKELEERLGTTKEALEKLPEPISGNSRIECQRMIKKCSDFIANETGCMNQQTPLWREFNKEFRQFKIEICSTRPVFLVGRASDRFSPEKFDILDDFLNSSQRATKKEKKIEKIEIKGYTEFTELDIHSSIDEAKGRLLSGFIPYSYVVNRINEFNKKWRNPAQACLQKINILMWKFIEKAIQDTFCRFPGLCTLMRQGILLEQCKTETANRIEFLFQIEIGYPFTLDEVSIIEAKAKYMTKLHEAVRRDGKTPTDTLEVIASIMAYFSLSFKRFTDNAAMIIIHSIIDEYAHLIEEKLMTPLLDPQDPKEVNLDELLGEDPSIAQERELLLQREKHLQELLTDLRRSGV